MNFRRNIVTLTIILINLVVYLVMVGSGVNFFAPSSENILDWGGNFDALVVKGEWWRLITAMFIHIGILHLVINMITLFFLGRQFEIKYGSFFLLLIYFISGIAANITSSYLNLFKVTAGASGAIFGIAGAHIALMLLNSEERKFKRGSGLSSLLIAVALNIYLGMKIKFLDMPGHMGGLLSGFCLGFCYYPLLRYKTMIRTVISTYVILILLSTGALYIAVKNLPPYKYWYFSMFQSFVKNDVETLRILKNPDSYRSELISKANIKSADQTWSINQKMLYMFHNVPPVLENDIATLKKYIRLRKKSLFYFTGYIDKNEYVYLDSVDYTIRKIGLLPPLTYRIAYPAIPAEKDSNDTKLFDFREYYDSTWQVTSAEKAVYYRIAKKDSIGNVNGFVTDYFINGHIQMKGKYSNNLKAGVFFYFNSEGKYEAYGEYKADMKTGIWKYFYNNGQPESIINYTPYYNYELAFWDSTTGAQLVTDGNGKHETHYSNGLIAETGHYKDGKREGIRKGFYESGKPYYFENYKNGNLIFGESIDKKGRRYRYDSEWISIFPIGLDSNETYQVYLAKHVRYPAKAREKKIEGIVVVQFNVDTLGNVKNPEPLTKLGSGCDEEAVRVIKEGLKFEPARHRGRPVEVMEKVPVTFSLR